MRYYPVFLDLAAQPCVVLGGGKLATEKAEGLLEVGATVRLIASRLSPKLEALAADALIEAVDRDYRPGDLAGALLAIDASEDQAIHDAAAKDLVQCPGGRFLQLARAEVLDEDLADPVHQLVGDIAGEPVT